MKKYLPISLALLGAFALGLMAMSYSNANNESVQASTHSAHQNDPDHAHPPPGEATQSQRFRAPTQTRLDNDPDTAFSDEQEDDVREIVRTYLLDNPEILVEAIGVFQERQALAEQEQAYAGAAQNLDVLLDNRNGYTNADLRPNAKVAVIELFDYHCGFCKQASGLVQQIAQSDESVVVAFREFPILRKESELAAEAALASRNQNKYLDFHFALMNANGVLTRDRIFDIAKKEKIDVAQLKTDMKDPNVASAIRETINIAQDMGASGTPAFVIASLDGNYLEVVSGFSPDRVIAAIAEAKSAN